MKRPILYKRRDFLSKSIGSVAAIAVGSNLFLHEKAFSTHAFNPADSILDQTDSILNPIIPFQYYPELESEMLAAIRSLREQYGFRRFLLTGPSKEFRYVGFPDVKVFENLGRQIRDVKLKLAGNDLEIGWWCATTIRIGKGNYQSIVREDGTIAQEACCPLDMNFRDTFSQYVALVVDSARPFLVNFEDDFHLNGGCYCDLHLTALAKRIGRYYNRKELLDLIDSDTAEAKYVREEWGAVCRESLEGLALAVRNKVDEIAPETRLCLCESGNSERDGNFTEAVTRAFAGKTRPIVRVHGTSYYSNQSYDIAQVLFNPLYKKQHLPSDFEIIHESDTFPHTRFFMSANKLNTLLTVVLAYGLDDSLFYATQYLNDPIQEKGYCEMFKRDYSRFKTLKLESRECQVVGCEVIRKSTLDSNWAGVMGRLGIPYTTKEGKIKLVSGQVVASLSNEEIETLLSKAVFLDGYAAYLLCQRGYCDLLGANVRSRQDILIPPFYERICHPDFHDSKHNLMYNYVWAFGDKEKSFFNIDPYNDAEIITDFVGSNYRSVSPAMIRFVNRCGGRVVTMAYNVDDTYVNTKSEGIFNYSKQTLIQQILKWLNPEAIPISVKNIPNSFCVFTKSSCNKYGVAIIVGLSADTFPNFSLNIAKEWSKCSMTVLNAAGNWEDVLVKRRISKNSNCPHSHEWEVNTPIHMMSPVVLKFIKTNI